MIILNYYRFYLSLLAGAAVYFTMIHSWWVWLCVSMAFRVTWFLIQGKYHKFLINKYFIQHEYEFKQLLGPYGIRMINKAESDKAIKESLSEVFIPDLKKLNETVKTLEMMDSLFQAGLRPDSDTYHLHDLKLKYAKHRLNNNK